MATIDEARAAYSAAVSSRKQAEAGVIAATQSLQAASLLVDECMVAEEVAMYQLGIAAGIPSEKLFVSARAKATVELQKSSQ